MYRGFDPLISETYVPEVRLKLIVRTPELRDSESTVALPSDIVQDVGGSVTGLAPIE